VSSFDLPIGWALGLALGTVRAGAFVAAGGLIPRSMPRTVRATPAIAFGLLIGHPLTSQPDIPKLVALAFMNAFVGFSLGWLLGLAVQRFQTAGAFIDITSGLTIGSVFDRDAMNTQGSISRIIDHAAMTLIIVGGGLGIAAKVIAASVQAVALDGSLHAATIVGPTAGRAVSGVVRAGLELALPVVGVLFLIELTLALVARAAPQMNAFLLGMPIKILTTMVLVSGLVVVFPPVTQRAVADAVASVRTVLRAFAG
jgi:flagellar biosynthesis protein FliR